MSEAKKQQNNLRLAMITSIAVFCMGQIPGSIDAAISKISEAFNLSATSGLYVTTVASIVSVIFSLFVGFAAGKKIGFKPLILFCAIVELLSAIFPFFTENFVFLLILRGLFGIGFGGMQAMENTVTAILVPPEKIASTLGLGMFFGFGMNCLLQFIGGILADIGWNYVFLNHILLIIPFVIILIGCSKMDFTPIEDGATQSDSDEKGKMPVSVYAIWILLLFVGIFIAPILIGCSFLSEAIVDSATVAGVVAVFFSVGCMLGGICYPKLFKVLGKNSLGVFLIMLALGYAGSAFVRNIPALCIFVFIAGMGFSMTQATCMMKLTMAVSPAKVAFVSAIMMSLFNLGMFCSSIFEEFIGKITGDSLYMPLYIGAVATVIFAVIALVTSKPQKSSNN